MNPIISSKQNAEHYKWGNNCDGWHLVKSKALSVIHELVPPDQGEIMHYHEYSEQYFYVLSGSATIIINDKRININSGEGLHVPQLVPHQLVNEGSCNLEFLVISSPPTSGDRIIINKK